NLTSYSSMLESILKNIQEIRNALIHEDIYEKTLTHRNDERYKKLNEKFLIFNKAKVLNNSHLNIDLNKIEQEYNDYIELDRCYLNLISFRQEMAAVKCEVNETIDKIEKIIFEKIKMWIHSARGHLTRENLASILINMKRLSLHMSSFKSKIDQQIDELLNYYESKMGRTMFIIRELIRLLIQDTSGIDPRKDIIQELYRLLENYPTNIGLIIIFQHPYFSLLFKIKKFPRNSIEYVLTHIQGDFIDTRQLEKRYNEFNEIYHDLIQQNLKPNMKLDQLITSIKLITRNIKQESNKIEWNAYVRSKVPKLVAYTFALWTLKKAEHSREAEDSDNRNNYLFQPYVAEVISIFRMF
ncbi:unnamed protein product, partial [Rotaria sp. Silwood2]